MKVWLDDVRYPPTDEWVWVKTVEECIRLLKDGKVESLSLDNDLGWVFIVEGEIAVFSAYESEPEGHLVVDWLIKNDVWPKFISVHTNNVVKHKKMCDQIEAHGPYNHRYHASFTPEGHEKTSYPTVIYEIKHVAE